MVKHYGFCQKTGVTHSLHAIQTYGNSKYTARRESWFSWSNIQTAQDLVMGSLHVPDYQNCQITKILLYTGCPRRNVQYFGRVFLMLNYTDITQNTYIQSWTVTEIMAREKCGHLEFPRSIRLQLYREPPLPVVIWLRAKRTLASFTAHELHPTR